METTASNRPHCTCSIETVPARFVLRRVITRLVHGRSYKTYEGSRQNHSKVLIMTAHQHIWWRPLRRTAVTSSFWFPSFLYFFLHCGGRWAVPCHSNGHCIIWSIIVDHIWASLKPNYVMREKEMSWNRTCFPGYCKMITLISWTVWFIQVKTQK